MQVFTYEDSRGLLWITSLEVAEFSAVVWLCAGRECSFVWLYCAIGEGFVGSFCLSSSILVEWIIGILPA